MNNTLHKTRIEIIRNNTVISTVTPDKQEGINDYEMSSSSSINSFPTLSIKSSNPEINTSFMGFSKADIVRLSVSSTPNNEYITLFEGEFSKKSTKFETKPEKLVLEIDAIHSFFRLSMLELSSSKEFMGITFGEFVTNLVNMTDIQSKIKIDQELSNTKITGLSHKTNAFRLFKEVCLILDAAVTFNTNNTVDIDFRAKRLDEIRARKVQTITDKDIINMVSEDSI